MPTTTKSAITLAPIYLSDDFTKAFNKPEDYPEALTPFEYAVYQGDLAQMRKMRVTLAESKTAYRKAVGRNAMTLAVLSGSEKVVEQLLAWGSSASSCDDAGCSPLILAIAQGKKPILKKLAIAGASLEEAQDITTNAVITVKRNQVLFPSLLFQPDVSNRLALFPIKRRQPTKQRPEDLLKEAGWTKNQLKKLRQAIKKTKKTEVKARRKNATAFDFEGYLAKRPVRNGKAKAVPQKQISKAKQSTLELAWQFAISPYTKLLEQIPTLLRDISGADLPDQWRGFYLTIYARYYAHKQSLQANGNGRRKVNFHVYVNSNIETVAKINSPEFGFVKEIAKTTSAKKRCQEMNNLTNWFAYKGSKTLFDKSLSLATEKVQTVDDKNLFAQGLVALEKLAKAGNLFARTYRASLALLGNGDFYEANHQEAEAWLRPAVKANYQPARILWMVLTACRHSGVDVADVAEPPDLPNGKHMQLAGLLHDINNSCLRLANLQPHEQLFLVDLIVDLRKFILACKPKLIGPISTRLPNTEEEMTLLLALELAPMNIQQDYIIGRLAALGHPYGLFRAATNERRSDVLTTSLKKPVAKAIVERSQSKEIIWQATIGALFCATNETNTAKGKAMLKTASDAGFVFAQMALAKHYFYSEQKPRLAYPFLLRAAKQGSVEAQFMLGTMLMMGDGIAVDNEKAKHWLKFASDEGDTSAGVHLAELHMRLHPEDENGILARYLIPANKNEFRAMAWVASHLIRKERYKEAKSWVASLKNSPSKVGSILKESPLFNPKANYQPNAKVLATHAKGYYGFGMLDRVLLLQESLYGEVIFSPEDIETFRYSDTAEGAFAQAVMRGHAGAWCDLGLYYESLITSSEFRQLAPYMYQHGSRLGDPAAMYQQANTLSQINGKNEADIWMNEAADKGYALAQVVVADMCETQKNSMAAKQWRIKALRQGDVWALKSKDTIANDFKPNRVDLFSGGIERVLSTLKWIKSITAIKGIDITSTALASMRKEIEGVLKTGMIATNPTAFWLWGLLRLVEGKEDAMDFFVKAAQQLANIQPYEKRVTAVHRSYVLADEALPEHFEAACCGLQPGILFTQLHRAFQVAIAVPIKATSGKLPVTLVDEAITFLQNGLKAPVPSAGA